MNTSPSAGTRNLSVSIVAGPSAGALLQQIGEVKEKRRLVLPAGSLAPDEHQALEQIIAITDDSEVEHLIIECDSQTPAMAYASLFVSPPLTETARLTKTLFVIQPSDLLDSLTRGAADAKRTP